MTATLPRLTSPRVPSAPRAAASVARRVTLGIPPTVLISFLIVLVVVLWSLVPGVFTAQSPVTGDTAQKLAAPSAAHWFGTDYLGRDLFARVVHGTAASVTSALVAVLIGLVIGGAIGLASGFLAGWVDSALGRLVDVLLAIPGFLLAVVIVSSLGFQTINAAIATGVSAVAVFARLTRAEVIKGRNAVFVEASYLGGGTRVHALLQHILPNAYRSVVALAVLQFGTSILIIASLAFLGYGDPPPSSEWGLLVASGKTYPTAPWLVYAPAVVIVVTVLSVNRISRWMRKTS
ncbi:ABC transporter permease [Leifsonia sp. Leaf264]|uniref:ABC transporter permease n=1 Tax=Leifsonia sp. Leaf264 TaxID=1736314 RepID=UPI0006F67A07|nr:ABC transporter permease [Leifsonia sp. Leaf264]KQO97651.1 peptide ABC transporter permease [Leifsonia sp. Leaf264]